MSSLPNTSDHETIERIAYEAFRSGSVSPEWQEYAREQIEARGLAPIIAKINAIIVHEP